MKFNIKTIGVIYLSGTIISFYIFNYITARKQLFLTRKLNESHLTNNEGTNINSYLMKNAELNELLYKCHMTCGENIIQSLLFPLFIGTKLIPHIVHSVHNT